MIPTYIVDDVDSDRYIARRRLTKAGCFTPLQEARDGADFLERYSQAEVPADGPPPLVLMDINMPELNGFETLEILRDRLEASGARMPVVAMFSSSDNERDVMRSAAIGVVDHYFTKPITDQAIATILGTFRERCQAI